MERNILAYFRSPEEANGVARKLQALKAIDVAVDDVSRYPDDGTRRRSNPLTGDIDSLASLTMDADISNRSEGILASTDVSASGMSDGGQDGVTGRNIVLTAVMDDSAYDKAMQVVLQAGGQI